MAPSHIPLSQLHLDPQNIRHAGTGSEPVYVATIEQHGIIEPLIVRHIADPGSKWPYLVMQGGKRLASLQLMAKEGKSARGTLVTGDYPVPVVIRPAGTAAEATEISLVTAICHMPIHPVDQYEAFAALADPKGGKLLPDEIARRFGCPRRIVDQRLALGRLSPKIRDAFRAGEMSAEVAAAFTLSGDHKQQESVLASVSRGHDMGARWTVTAVKQAIGGKDGKLGGPALALVGVAAYEAAGGKVLVDLFDERNSIVTEPAILQKLVDDKIAASCAELVAAGWQWARPDAEIKNKWEYKAINKKVAPTPEEKGDLDRLAKVLKVHEEYDDDREAQLRKLGLTDDQIEDDEYADVLREQHALLYGKVEARSFTDKDRAKSGCTVALAQNGKLLITYGLIKPEKSAGRPDASGSSGASPSRNSAPAEKVKKPDISNALGRDIKGWLADATKAAITADSYKDDRAVLLSKLVAGQISTGNGSFYHGAFSDKEMAALRDQATPAVVKAAFAKAFDADRYFAGVSQKLRLKHLDEMGHDGAAPGKALATIALCKKLAASTSWLPATLRWAHYDGPGGGKTKRRAKR